MQKNLHTLLNEIKGNWFLQENFYFLDSKRQKQYREKVSFVKNSQNNKFNIVSFLFNYINSDKSLFKLKKVKANIVTITNKNRHIYYKEYIHIVSNNFMISLIIVKNLQKKKYLGVKISSYIRLIQ
uniref:hypothetical protein n=1 Tax=Deltalsia parasitica TaxID=1424640 RepID=UPI0022FDA69F|nr:hypothetical protein PN064_pgp118 [Deltalsia parasitica]WAX02885.1 hypothetical protein [Deltalsia parasitica]